MLAILGLVPLLVMIYARPQEHFDWLQQVPVLYISCAFALFGLVMDWRLRLTRPVLSPQAPWAALLAIWIVVGAATKLPGTLVVPEIMSFAVALVLLAVIAHGIDTLRGLRAIGATLAAICLFLTAVGIHQGLASTGCILLDQTDLETLQSGTFDGRPCSDGLECYAGEAAPGGEYACEHVGLLGTTSVEGRVRYRGILQDPNELALAVSCALPLLFALAAGRRRMSWKILAFVGTIAVFVLLLMTQSRSGQLVFFSVLGVYLIRRFRWRGVLIAAMVAMPAIVLGWRSGAEADESGEFRLESWAAGFDMLRQSPVIGVGKGMFVEYNFLTAHNSYILAAAELGIVGYLLWAGLLYVSLKIGVSAVRRLEGIEAAATARAWALAIVASTVGMLVGMMFLSLAYHYVIWTHLALCGALHTMVRRHDPAWRVEFSLGDAALVAAGAMGLLAAIAGYLRLRGY